MKVRYDKDADAIYIKIAEEEYEVSEEIGSGVVIDLSKEGKIIGMEILDASEKFSKTRLKEISA